MPTFFVYENWRAPGAHGRVHFSLCRYCNDGKGIHQHASNRSGRWYGPFTSFDKAYDAARQFGRYRSKCKHCKPH